MTVRTADYLKTKFEAGDIPTADDMIDLIDSFLLANLTNFPSTLPASSGQFLTNLPVPSASTINVNEFNVVTGTPVYLTANSFTMPGNLVSYFPLYRRIRLLTNALSFTLSVVSCSYDAGQDKTIIGTLEAIGNSGLTECQVATVLPFHDDGSVSQQVAGFSRGSNLTAAATLDIGFLHYSFDVDGNTEISAISDRALGTYIRLKFNGSPKLVHSSALSLHSAGDLTVVPGDSIEFEKVSAGWRQVSNASLSQSFGSSLWDLRLSANGQSSTVSVSAVEVSVRASNGLHQILNSVSLSIDCGSSGANGLDTGTLAANSWYAVFVIWNGATPAGLISLNAYSPTMPSGYTHKRRVGWIRTDTTINKYPLSFIQRGNDFQYQINNSGNLIELPNLYGGSTNGVWTPVHLSYVPATAVAIKVMLYVIAQPNTYAQCSPNDQYTTPPLMHACGAGGTYASVSLMGDFLLESGYMYYASTCTLAYLYARGWTDTL